MNRLSTLRLSFAASLVAVALPLAAQTTSTNVIISCVSKLSGVSRIVAAPTACNAVVENVVMWNQQGPAGAPGTPGTPGATGSAGPTGPAGPQGAPGLTYRGAFNADTFPYNKNDVVTYGGSTYIALTTAGGFPPTSFLNQTSHEWGLLVPQGATGAQGIQGVAGPIGPQGVAGPTGPQGATGPQGPSGGVPTLTFFYGRDKLYAGNQNYFSIACPKSIDGGPVQAVTGGCGYGNTDTGEQTSVQMNYSGPEVNYGTNTDGSPTAWRCEVTNPNLEHDRDILYSVGCSGNFVQLFNLSLAKTAYKSCTYDPATQLPCTEAEAVVTDPRAAVKQPASSQSVASSDAVANTTGAKADRQRVTLWFTN